MCCPSKVFTLGGDLWLVTKWLVAGGMGLGLENSLRESKLGRAGDGDKCERKEEGAKTLNSKANYSTHFERQEQDSLQVRGV